MRIGIISGLVAMSMMVGAAFADTVTIASGKEGGGYNGWAKEVAVAYAQRGEEAIVVPYKGSDDITLNLCAAKADFGPAQQDAAYQRMLEGCDLQELWTYSGEEYMFLMVPPDSDIDELIDLSSASIVVAGDEGSGGDFTLRNLRRIESGELGNQSGWEKTGVKNTSLKAAIGPGASGKIQAAFFVGASNSDNMKFFLKNGWTPVEIYDKNLDDLQFNGKPLYVGQKVSIPDYGRIYTYQVKAFVYGRELGGDEQAVFESIMSTR